MKRRGPGLREVSLKENHSPNKWKIIRWSFLIFINFLFFASYHFDIQVLEGTLSGSRFFGFHLADPFVALQTMFASKIFNINLIIGGSTIVIFYLLFGGRSFCSWVCPFHFLAEMTDYLKKFLKKKKILKYKQINFDKKLKYFLFFLFIGTSALTGLNVFEVANPVAALSRSFVYGPGIILIFVLGILIFELLFVRRGWCRFFCPVGVSYIFLGYLLAPVDSLDFRGAGFAIELDDIAYLSGCQDSTDFPQYFGPGFWVSDDGQKIPATMRLFLWLGTSAQDGTIGFNAVGVMRSEILNGKVFISHN